MYDAIAKEAWFSADEYARRLAAVREQMRQQELDALVVFSPANVYYLTGHHSIDTWEFRAAVISHDAAPELLLYQFERGRFLASSWLAEARFYSAADSPVIELASLLRDRGLGRARLGIEEHGAFNHALMATFDEELPLASHVRVARVVDRVRLRKSEEELACIRSAADLTRIGIRAARESIAHGARDHDVVAAALAAMLRAGSHNPVMPPTVAVGYRSGLSHSEHNSAALQQGDAVFVELSGCWRHYSAPLMYTTTIGPPRDEWLELMEAAHQVAESIVAAARPGVPARDVARRARETMRAIEGRVQFHYNFGYSVGASFPPHWLEESGFHIKEGNSAPLEAGMVFHVPLTMRVLGRFAAGTSRTIEITDSGARVLTGPTEERG